MFARSAYGSIPTGPEPRRGELALAKGEVEAGRRPLRIALFTETFLPATDGVVTRLKHTIEELQGMGDELLVFAPRYPIGASETYAGAQIYRVFGIPFPPYPEVRLCPPNPRIGRALNRFRPDLIHAVNPFVLGPGGAFYARRNGVPLVASYHTNIAAYARFYGFGFLENATKHWIRTWHNRARLNLCTSEATRDYLWREGIKWLRLWPQGVDARLFNPGRATKEWRAKLSGGHPEKKILLYVGRLAPEKGIERLKTALKAAPDARLAIVGKGPAREYLEKKFADTPTVFTGLLTGDDLAAAYASSDLFVFPSTTETLGMAMIEALASGVPVVAARSGASHEIVDEGTNGLLYEPYSLETMTVAVRRVLSDDGLRSRMSREARNVAEGRSWRAATATLRGYYEEALTP
jgi:glycosyltransferase involved in cell wall biosynthesis